MRSMTPAEKAFYAGRISPVRRCQYCGLLATPGCLCDLCVGDAADWMCGQCLRAEAIADDALLGEVSP